MSRNDASNSTGKDEPHDKRPKEGHQRHKVKLETVVERSNEISCEYTDRIGPGAEARKTRRSSPFVVEKFDLDLDVDDEPEEEGGRSAGARGPLRLNMGQAEKEKLSSRLAGLDIDLEPKLPASSYRTPAKKERQDQSASFADPSNSLKSGFFSVRKRSSKPESIDIRGGAVHFPAGAPSSAKIKIVNNIFQNTYLQSVVKPELQDAFKKKLLKDVKTEEKACRLARKRGNASMEIKETPKAKRPAPNLLCSPNSPKNNPCLLLQPQAPAKPPNESGTPKAVDDLATHRLIFGSFDACKKPQLGLLPSASDLQQLAQYRKFHAKVTGLMKDLGREPTSTAEEDTLKQSWRFIKDIVEGYVEAKKKINKLEEILHGK
jgi:hypothetical protein